MASRPSDLYPLFAPRSPERPIDAPTDTFDKLPRIIIKTLEGRKVTREQIPGAVEDPDFMELGAALGAFRLTSSRVNKSEALLHLDSKEAGKGEITASTF